MAKLTMDGYQLNYASQISNRNNPTLLFIHNSSMDASEWSLIHRHIGQEFNVVTYDSCGHGQSDSSDNSLTLEQLMYEPLAVMNHLHLNKVHIIGSGMGANIGYELARKYPERVASLTLMSAIFYFQEAVYGRILSLQTQLVDIDRDLLMRKLLIDSIYTLNDEKSLLFEKAFKRIPNSILKQYVSILQSHYDPAFFHFTDELKQLNVPTLVMHGSNDPFFPAQLAAIFALCIPDSRWLIIPEAARLLPLDQPKLTAQCLIKFILSKKLPLPIFPIHQELVSKFRDILKTSFERSLVHGHLLSINIMRNVEVLWNGKPIEGKWNQRGAKELLLFLILNHGKANREELINTFLSHLPREHARNNLRVRINHLNQIFHNFHDPDVHEILLIGEDTVSLNAEIKSDIGEYMDHLLAFPINNLSLNKQAIQFIDLLKAYDPANFSSFRGDWIFTLTDQIETQLSDIMQKLLKKLKEKKEFGLFREMVQSGRSIEPYDGFCDEQLAELQISPR